MQAFAYSNPASVAEAAKQAAQEDAKIMAGGQTLLQSMKLGLIAPSAVVDISGINELKGITVAGGKVTIGAGTTHAAVAASKEVQKAIPALAELAGNIGDRQVRNRGTIGGSLAHADPSGELPVAAVALDAEFVLRSKRGERVVLARDFFEGLMTTALAEDELLCECRVPAAPARTGWEFREVARRHGDYAHAGVAARLTLAEDGKISTARVVYLSAGDVPVSAERARAALEGEAPSEDLFAEAARIASKEEIDPNDDIHATAAFKRHLAEALTRRALAIALERAREASPS